MTANVLRRRIAFTLASAITLALGAAEFTHAGKGKGGSGGATVPPGTIYFYRVNLQEHWSMKGDGKGKARSQWGEPTRAASARRWFLQLTHSTGDYPSPGRPRYVLIASSEDGLEQSTLVDDPNIQVEYFRWSFNDGVLYFDGLQYEPVADNGDFTDPMGQDWNIHAVLFAAPVDWSSGVPVLAAPAVPVLYSGTYFASVADGVPYNVAAEIEWFDVSPSGVHVVYRQTTGASPTTSGTSELVVAAYDASLGLYVPERSLGPGRQPEWSGDGTRIVFHRDWRIWTIRPDGTGPKQLTSKNGAGDESPTWSPDGKFVAFQRLTVSNVGYVYQVLRVPAAGGAIVNLTSDSGSSAAPAWRP